MGLMTALDVGGRPRGRALTLGARARAGPNMSSMLAQRVAINKLANSFMAFNTNYQDSGLFGVYAVVGKDQSVDDLARALPRPRRPAEAGWHMPAPVCQALLHRSSVRCAQPMSAGSLVGTVAGVKSIV
jgi:hypothetical protein